MSFRSEASLPLAASLAALLVVSACSNDPSASVSQIETIDIPAANAGPQASQNINNPVLKMPASFLVADS